MCSIIDIYFEIHVFDLAEVAYEQRCNYPYKMQCFACEPFDSDCMCKSNFSSQD